jgi:hypothetical protein
MSHDNDVLRINCAITFIRNVIIIVQIMGAKNLL